MPPDAMTTDELIAAWAEFAGPASVAYKRHPIVAPLVYAGDTLAAALREREGPREVELQMMLDAVSRALLGQPLSDFEESFAPVREVLDLQARCVSLEATPREPRDLVALVQEYQAAIVHAEQAPMGEPYRSDVVTESAERLMAAQAAVLAWTPTTPTPAPDGETRRPWNMNGPRITPVAPPADAPTETRTCGNCKHFDIVCRNATAIGYAAVNLTSDDGCLKGFTPKDGPR